MNKEYEVLSVAYATIKSIYELNKFNEQTIIRFYYSQFEEQISPLSMFEFTEIVEMSKTKFNSSKLLFIRTR